MRRSGPDRNQLGIRDLIFLAPYLDLTDLWDNLRPQMIAIDALRATLGGHLPVVTPPPLVPIQEIMIGPSGHQGLNLKSFAKLLKQPNRTGVTIDRSQIPYRGLS
jgi:hypothetical protein